MDPAHGSSFTDFGLIPVRLRLVGNSASPRSTMRWAGCTSSYRGGPRSRESCGSFRVWRSRRATRRGTASLSIRLYADSARVGRLPGSQITLPPGGTGSVHIALPSQSPVQLGPGFAPLGIVVVPVGDRTWTREIGFPEVGRALAP